MVGNRVISFPRQIAVCLSFCLIAILFVLSCQKDEGLKQKDPNALTKSQAKEYFENNAETLQFLKFLPCSPSTKSPDSLSSSSILISNMVIDWDNTFIGETSDQYYAEVPIKMISPLKAIIYDGIGHYNKNIHTVDVNVSMLITQDKETGLFEHREVIGVGTYISANTISNYPYSSDKSSFTGYLIFCNEKGEYLSSNVFSQGRSRSSELFSGNFTKVDSTGKDIRFRGISFLINRGALTKGGGGGASSGEDNICPICGAYNTISYINGFYYCSSCMSSFVSGVDFICPDCSYPFTNCQCICWKCGFVKSQCKCLPDDEDICPYCYTPGCTGQCQYGNGSWNNGNNYAVSVSCDSLGGYVSFNPSGGTYQYNTNITLTAHPYSGYVFAGWYESGSLVSTNNPYTFSVNRNYSLVCEFDSN